MKITVEIEEGQTEVYPDVLDFFICVRQSHSVADKERIGFEIRTMGRSHHTGGLRELIKETRQSLIDMELKQAEQAAKEQECPSSQLQ